MNRNHVINILSDKTYDACHIFGTTRVALEDLADYVSQFDKNTELVVYSAHYQDYSSYEAAKLLKALGYTHIYLYAGGTADWHQQGLPTTGSCVADYLQSSHNPKIYEKPNNIAIINAQEFMDKIDILL
jgi:rhodanese-related sulfurtransferase